MKPRDLLKNPCWCYKDLGEAMPDSPHAVSVALPRWEDVIAYEEKNPYCIQSLKTIYPRFGLNPFVSEIAQKAITLYGSNSTTAWPYPNKSTAQKAKIYCDRICTNEKTTIHEILGLSCLIVNEETTSAAKAFWQHTGLGASSRQAAIALKREPAPSKQASKEAKKILKTRLAEIYKCSSSSIELLPSGMAALNLALEAIRELNPNRPTLQIGFPYVDVLKLPQVIYEGSQLLLPSSLNHLEAILESQKPSAVIVEVPSNPLLQCVDLPSITKLAHKKGIPVIADDTIGSPINIDCTPFADLIFSSLTKSFAGRGDILAGSLIVSPHSLWKDFLSERIKLSSSTLFDADAIALEKASRDVTERLPKLNYACSFLAENLAKHPSVKRVLHPGKCPNFQALMRQKGGYGCLLSFELEGGLNKAKKFYNQLKICKGPSLGTNFTLACPYVLLAHYEELEWAEQCGVPAHLLRVSVGLEDPEILWKRFKNALST